MSESTRSSKRIAADLHKSWSNIETLRRKIAEEYDKVIGLLEEDGQPHYEVKMVQDFKTVQKNVLRFETVHEVNRWQDARNFL